jgi:hypothetical protein
MITKDDNDYKLTKLIKQGKASINSDFEELADWICRTYNVKPINIIYDLISGYQGKLNPRLEIVFEFLKEKNIFIKEDINYDPVKQKAISQQFKKILIAKGFTLEKNIWNMFGGHVFTEYDTNNLFIAFTAFEPVAREEANGSIQDSLITDLEKEINNSELWKIATGFQSATVFFYTDSQVKENEASGLKEFITKKYFDLLKPYDEFDYYKENEFSIAFDSKENFDNNYGSSWFDYYR